MAKEIPLGSNDVSVKAKSRFNCDARNLEVGPESHTVNGVANAGSSGTEPMWLQ